MSANPVEIRRENAPSQPVVNDAWYLHSRGRLFGPLSEDEMRTYFRASMVHAGDTIAIAGQHGTTSAVEVAALLGMPPPAPALVLQHAPTTILITDTGVTSSIWVKLVAFVAIVAIFGIAYIQLVVPLRPPADSQTAILPNQARSIAPVAVEESLAQPVQAFPVAAPEEEASPFQLAPTAESAPGPAPPATTPVSAGAAPVAEATPAAAARDEWWLEAVRLTESAQDWAGLLAHATKWTSSQPNRDAAWWFLGLANARLGNWDRATEAIDRALAITPDRFNMSWRYALLHMEYKKFQESARILGELSAQQPRNHEVWNDLGIAQANLGEYDEAVAAFEKAVQVKPDYRKAWKNLAQSYAHFGNMDKANAALAKANGR